MADEPKDDATLRIEAASAAIQLVKEKGQGKGAVAGKLKTMGEKAEAFNKHPTDDTWKAFEKSMEDVKAQIKAQNDIVKSPNPHRKGTKPYQQYENIKNSQPQRDEIRDKIKKIEAISEKPLAAADKEFYGEQADKAIALQKKEGQGKGPVAGKLKTMGEKAEAFKANPTSHTLADFEQSMEAVKTQIEMQNKIAKGNQAPKRAKQLKDIQNSQDKRERIKTDINNIQQEIKAHRKAPGVAINARETDQAPPKPPLIAGRPMEAQSTGARGNGDLVVAVDTPANGNPKAAKVDANLLAALGDAHTAGAIAAQNTRGGGKTPGQSAMIS